MEESATGQPVGLRKGDPGLTKSFLIRQYNTHIIGSPRDGHILSRINCFLSRACNLSRHCGHDWSLRLMVRKKLSHCRGLITYGYCAPCLPHRDTEKKKMERRKGGEETASLSCFSQQKEDRGKKISKLRE